MSWSQSVLEAVEDISIAKLGHRPSLKRLEMPGPTTPHLLRVREEIVEAEPKRRRSAKVLKCALTLIDSDQSECEGLQDSDFFKTATASSQRQIRDSDGFQPMKASSGEDSLLVLAENAMDVYLKNRVEDNRRQRAIDSCLARIVREAPHDDDIGENTLRDEAEGRAHIHELRVEEEADLKRKSDWLTRKSALAVARGSSFEEEVRLLVEEPCICAQALQLFEGDFEEDCAVALKTARRIIGALSTSGRFYIGICASPILRWHIAGHGHVHTWARMCLCGGFEAHRAALVETRAIDEFLGQSSCANQRAGGGGRGPAGSLGFVYVCHGDGL
jgi:hypothetical protein